MSDIIKATLEGMQEVSIVALRAGVDLGRQESAAGCTFQETK